MILVVGDLLLDVFLLSRLREAEQDAGIVVRPGGSAANTAAWLAGLGHPTVFLGCVGQDVAGRMLVEDLHSFGVETLVRECPGQETGVVAVEVGHDGERIMKSSRGANAELTSDDMLLPARSQPSFVHLTGYSLLGPAGLSILHSVARLAHVAGARISFDPSSPSVIAKVGAERLVHALVEARIDILLPNLEEAAALTGTAGADSSADILMNHAPIVMVKLGPDGCLGRVDRQRIVCGTEVVDPVDTTGAGDAFDAGFLGALASGFDVPVASAEGNRLSRQVLGHYGGRPGAQNVSHG